MSRLSCLLVAVIVGCASATAPDVIGKWGGTQASLTLDRSGGSVNYPCGASTIDASWTLSANGQFTATGVYYFGGGPAPVGGRDPHLARYTGTVKGDRLTFSLTLLDSGETLGPFHLVRGGSQVFEICV